MHLIIRYYQPSHGEEESAFPPEHEWLPTWRIDGPDEQPEHSRGPTLTLTGEKRLPIVPPGEALEPGGIYLDLKNPALGPFRSLEGQMAGEGNAYISQGDLPPDFWNQLVRICSRAGALVLDAERTGAQFDVTLVLEPVETTPESQPSDREPAEV